MHLAAHSETSGGQNARARLIMPGAAGPHIQLEQVAMPPTNTVDRRNFLRMAAVALAATQAGLVSSAHAQSLNALTPNSSESFRSEPNGNKGNLMSSSSIRLAAPE